MLPSLTTHKMPCNSRKNEEATRPHPLGRPGHWHSGTALSILFPRARVDDVAGTSYSTLGRGDSGHAKDVVSKAALAMASTSYDSFCSGGNVDVRGMSVSGVGVGFGGVGAGVGASGGGGGGSGAGSAAVEASASAMSVGERTVKRRTLSAVGHRQRLPTTSSTSILYPTFLS
jgi:hypothetical protein